MYYALEPYRVGGYSAVLTSVWGIVYLLLGPVEGGIGPRWWPGSSAMGVSLLGHQMGHSTRLTPSRRRSSRVPRLHCQVSLLST